MKTDPRDPDGRAGDPPTVTGASHSAGLDGEERLIPGDLLDRKYRVERRLGAGGMGVVYQVLHVGLGRIFAAKVIQNDAAADPRFLHRFRVEAEALGGLQHPNIVNVTDFGVDQDRDLPYLVTEYLDGETLADRLRAAGPLPVSVALPLLGAISDAIDHAHRHRVLHLDLKPANVFLARRNGSEQIRILDFGLAHVMRGDSFANDTTQSVSSSSAASQTREDASWRLGTPPYMAPELAQGKPPLRASDVYAFGILVYEVLTGKRPFEGTLFEVIESHVNKAPPLPSGVNLSLPPELDAAILAALAKDPGARPATAAGVVTRLRAASDAAALRTWRRREVPRRTLWAAGLALLSALILPIVSGLGPIEQFEGRSVDARFATLAARQPDPRILLLVIDDDVRQKETTPLGAQGDRIGTQLQGVALAGARGIAIDLLLPEVWGQTEGFTQLVLRHERLLTLAAYSAPDGSVIGPECIAGAATVALGPDRAAALFGFVNASADPDGVHRRARASYLGNDGRLRPSWAAHAASTVAEDGRQRSGHTFWIDRSVDWTGMERVRWQDLGHALATRPDIFRDRLVLVGATYAASGDDVRLWGRSDDTIPGLVFQALAVNSILSGFRIRDAPPWIVYAAVSLLAAAVSGAILLRRRLTEAGVLAITAFVAYGAVAFLVFYRSTIMLPVAGPLAAIALAAALATALRFTTSRAPSS